MAWNKSPGRQRFDAWRERQRARERIERDRAAIETMRKDSCPFHDEPTPGCSICAPPKPKPETDDESGLSVNEQRAVNRIVWEMEAA